MKHWSAFECVSCSMRFLKRHLLLEGPFSPTERSRYNRSRVWSDAVSSASAETQSAASREAAWLRIRCCTRSVQRPPLAPMAQRRRHTLAGRCIWQVHSRPVWGQLRELPHVLYSDVLWPLTPSLKGRGLEQQKRVFPQLFRPEFPNPYYWAEIEVSCGHLYLFQPSSTRRRIPRVFRGSSVFPSPSPLSVSVQNLYQSLSSKDTCDCI